MADAQAADIEGVVLPPEARPHGTSLADMAEKSALFFTSGNDPTLYPSTPFQILYADWSAATYTPIPDGAGQELLIEGGNDLDVVLSGTVLYVPVYNLDDSPPVLARLRPLTRDRDGGARLTGANAWGLLLAKSPRTRFPRASRAMEAR